MVIEVYLVVGGDGETLEVYGVFLDPVDADRACAKCPRRYGGSRQWYRVEQMEVGELWTNPL